MVWPFKSKATKLHEAAVGEYDKKAPKAGDEFVPKSDGARPGGKRSFQRLTVGIFAFAAPGFGSGVEGRVV